MASARMRFVLTRSEPDGRTPSIVFQKTFIDRARLPVRPTADQVVTAFSEALQHILIQLRGELLAIPGEGGKKGEPDKPAP